MADLETRVDPAERSEPGRAVHASGVDQAGRLDPAAKVGPANGGGAVGKDGPEARGGAVEKHGKATGGGVAGDGPEARGGAVEKHGKATGGGVAGDGDGAGQGVEPVDGAAPDGKVDAAELEQRVVEALRGVYDPEIPVNIYELGLVYSVDVTEAGAVDVKMTLTAPGCPVAFTMPLEIEARLRSVPGVSDARVQVVWEPPWNMNMMSEAAKLQLGFW